MDYGARDLERERGSDAEVVLQRDVKLGFVEVDHFGFEAVEVVDVAVANEDLVEDDATERSREPSRGPLATRGAIGEVAMGVDAGIEGLGLPDVDHGSTFRKGVDAAAKQG